VIVGLAPGHSDRRSIACSGFFQIEIADQEVKFDTIHVTFKLTFDNKTADRTSSALIREEARLPAVSSSILFEIFPFIIVYGEDMVIQTIGRCRFY
jgi:guanylate cyclase